MFTFLQRVRDRNLVNILSTNIDVSVTRGFTIDTINWSRWPKQWLFIRWCKINFIIQIIWTIHWCHLRVFQGDREGLHKVSESKKNGQFRTMFSLLTFTCLDQQENQQQRGMLLKKIDKNSHAISKEQRSTHILLVTNLHFKIKCYSWHNY